MNWNKMVSTLAVAIVVSTPAALEGQQHGAFELNGTWELEFPAPWGVVVWIFELEQDGQTLTGESVQGMGTLVIDGTITGHELDFAVEAIDGPHELRLEFSGMGSPDGIGGVVTFEDGSTSDWTFTHGEGPGA